MKIPKSLPQFSKNRAFMCVIGAKYGLIYFMSTGEILMLDEVEQEIPFLGEKEGFFMSTSKGYMMGSWEDDTELRLELQKRFIKQIREELKIYISHLAPKTVYLFAPEYMHKKLLTELEHIKNVHFEVIKKGNYTKASPLELLTSIDTTMNAETDMTEPSSVDTKEKNSLEKIKILEKYKQAQSHI